jgi:hypothetical protein
MAHLQVMPEPAANEVQASPHASPTAAAETVTASSA